MNIIIAKLATILSLKTKLMMSKDGKHLFLLIKADESDITTTAMNIKYNAQLEIGYTDLSSLEPCDQNLRQFRTLKKPKSALGERLLQKEFRLKNLYAFINKERVIKSKQEQEQEDEKCSLLEEKRDKLKSLVKNKVPILQWEIYERNFQNF
jgi:hypothetical protein